MNFMQKAFPAIARCTKNILGKPPCSVFLPIQLASHCALGMLMLLTHFLKSCFYRVTTLSMYSMFCAEVEGWHSICSTSQYYFSAENIFKKTIAQVCWIILSTTALCGHDSVKNTWCSVNYCSTNLNCISSEFPRSWTELVHNASACPGM